MMDTTYLLKIYRRGLSVVGFGVPWTSTRIWAKGFVLMLELIAFHFMELRKIYNLEEMWH